MTPLIGLLLINKIKYREIVILKPCIQIIFCVFFLIYFLIQIKKKQITRNHGDSRFLEKKARNQSLELLLSFEYWFFLLIFAAARFAAICSNACFKKYDERVYFAQIDLHFTNMRVPQSWIDQCWLDR